MSNNFSSIACADAAPVSIPALFPAAYRSAFVSADIWDPFFEQRLNHRLQSESPSPAAVRFPSQCVACEERSSLGTVVHFYWVPIRAPDPSLV